MEIHEKGEIYYDKDGDLQFEFTKVIIKMQNHQYFYATTKDRMHTLPSLDLNSLELFPISIEHIWPHFSDQFTRAPDLSPEKYYIKEPSLLGYGEGSTTVELSNDVLHEVSICETLKANPHQNIGVYTGCVVTGGRIQGLCFVRYKMTLEDRLNVAGPFDKDLCLREIEQGIRHLHSLGLVHNDIKPTNIMVNESDRPVIIDFGVCYHLGKRLGFDLGTMDWSMGTREYVTFESDFFGLSKLREYMLEVSSN